MNTQQFPQEQTAFLQAVYDMRTAQRGYFAQPTQHRLKDAKIKEYKVDVLLAPYVTAGAVKPKQIANTPKLF